MSRKIQGYTILAAIGLIALSFLFRKIEMMHVADSFMVISAFVAGYRIFIKALKGLRFKIIGIELLVTIAVIGAIIIGEYWEAAAVTFLFMLGSYLEVRTLEKTRSSLEKLMEYHPSQATILENGNHLIIAAEDVKKGDIVIVKPGEKIPVDGVIIKGSATINQSMITGESIPIFKQEKDNVFSGTINESGFMHVEAINVGEDTTLSKIIEMVEDAQESKAKTQKFLEKFAKYYTPLIIILAILLWVVTNDIRIALTLLVISCPGALVISVPISIVAGIGHGARNGVLIKGGEYIEKLAKIDVVAFDKTGTLTKGTPKVINVKPYGVTSKELLMKLASAECASEHPLGKAIVERAKEEGIEMFESPDHFEVVLGKGIIASLGNETLFIGNRLFIKEKFGELSDRFIEELSLEENLGRTVVIAATKTKIMGIISIADEIREDAYTLVKSLKASGIKKVIMITGDNLATAKAVGDKLGLDEVYAEKLPSDKVNVVKSLQKNGHKVAMVGDGINDAPALAIADTSIAMGVAGTDVAMDTADVILMNDKLSQMEYLFKISRFTVKNLKQNIFFSISVVVLLILGVIGNVIFMTSGMLIHELSVLLVILNALRIVVFKDKKNKSKSDFALEKKGVLSNEM
ncbi:heavy metal translocating P-type ATPase [Anaerobacillus isosaccharinicus]|uniref:Cd(2+)-exporting ATPase n=1 Tax=Anaerobacillus isosaccharinicus TaxID=1532552 RepID=A0A1S2L6H8_9BACI|nr:cation-translocating P-type ATPase [Anaerobacillus isosaccharinicus]MBA5584869.1 cadmium-translocating P-type ATPase [Anaerobacillus isosaccharinicus]QOY36770.1 cadmium-translocating P-type ATPase [Anaerobacillus isosaccharinicus]